mgnify:CR=1 FL=1
MKLKLNTTWKQELTLSQESLKSVQLGANQARLAYVLNTDALKDCIAILKAALDVYPHTTR